MELAAACSCVNLMQSYTYRKFRYFASAFVVSQYLVCGQV